jgi:DNA-directed RNA polymerase specialized sigma24 family protein
MDTERALMAKVARGDQAAFTELAQRYSGKLLAVAGRLLGSRADAEDAVQRAFLQCFAAAAGYDPRWAVSTWLYRILTNVCVDELRRRATRTAHHDRSAAGELLALRYVDGLSYGELARIRGISVNTVKSQLARGKSLLRAELGKRGADHV